MDWLFENLGKLAPIVIFLLYMISSMKGRGQEEEAPDPEAAERARKIQEEIRRKILERQRGSEEPTGRPPAPPQPAEETIFFDEEPEPIRTPPPLPTTQRMDLEEPPPLPSIAVDSFTERRRKIEAQLEEAKRKKAQALEKAKSIWKVKGAKPSVSSPIVSGEIRDRLKSNLRDRDSLKTAILLKEVLDTPVGLR